MLKTILFKLSYSNAVHHVLTFSAVATIIVGGLYLSTTISGYNHLSLLSPVDKLNCECSCWDGFYRGAHGRGSNYKAFYFNYDPHWVIILLLFMLSSYLLFHIVAKIVNLLIYELTWIIIKGVELLFQRRISLFNAQEHDSRFLNENDCQFMNENRVKIPILKTYYPRLRVFILAALGVSIYSNYYGVWAFINYLNDRDYRMIRSQLFYTITETVPTYVYFKLLDRYETVKLVDYNECLTKLVKLKYVFQYRPIELSYIWPILNISIVHILLAMPEGMFVGFSNKQPLDEMALQRKIAINARDLALMTTDFIAISISVFVVFKEFLRIRVMDTCKRQSAFRILKCMFITLELKLWLLTSISFYLIYKLFCTF